MSIKIDLDLCAGCRMCKEICPGNLIKSNENDKSFIKYPEDCWGCSSCVKVCSVNAVKYYLGADISGTGSFAYTNDEGQIIRWVIEDKKGNRQTIDINKNNANAY